MAFLALSTPKGGLVAILGWGAGRVIGVFGRAVGPMTPANDELPGAA